MSLFYPEDRRCQSEASLVGRRQARPWDPPPIPPTPAWKHRARHLLQLRDIQLDDFIVRRKFGKKIFPRESQKQAGAGLQCGNLPPVDVEKSLARLARLAPLDLELGTQLNRPPLADITQDKDRMSQSEVFRPQEGPLLLRGNLANGMPIPTDTFRKSSSRPASQGRPATQGSNSGYRWGNLSHNQFFARHNPHPARVRHLKGLLDVPICTVNDSGYFANPRYSLQFPPDNYDEKKLVSSSRLPVNAINVNSQLHPINTITGLQYFMGKPLNCRIFREKAIPKVGMVPVTEAWRDELRALTEAIHSEAGQKAPPPPPQEERRPKTQYSAETGRLIPPPSRAMSRGASRGAQRDKMLGQFHHIMEEPDTESMVLQMLCQVLQTDDVNAVQAWLVSAGDREKSLVLDMIKAALVSNEEYYKRQADRPATGAEACHLPAPGTTLPAIPETNKPGSAGLVSVDRLSFEPMPRPSSQQEAIEAKYMRYSYSPMTGEQRNVATPMLEETKPPVTPQDVFRPKSQGGDRLGTAEPRLRFTRTPSQEQTNTWQPDQSVAVQN